MEQMAPPYWAPYMTPPSIRMAPTGFIPKVSGSKIEIVASGPMPGSTPTMLPTSTPMKHHMRFCGSSATPKPYQRSVSAVEITLYLPLQQGHGNLQDVAEQADPEGGHDRRQDERALPSRGLVAERRDEDAGEGPRDHAADLAEDDEQCRAGQDAHPGKPLRVLGKDALILGVRLARQRGDRRDCDAETDQNHAERG